MIRGGMILAAAALMLAAGGNAHAKMAMRPFRCWRAPGRMTSIPSRTVQSGSPRNRPGKLGWLDPRTSKSDLIALGPGAAPHGVIVGPDGAAWVTESGQNAIARIDPATHAVKLFPRC
jgi:virginiamycin B lyase